MTKCEKCQNVSCLNFSPAFRTYFSVLGLCILHHDFVTHILIGILVDGLLSLFFYLVHRTWKKSKTVYLFLLSLIPVSFITTFRPQALGVKSLKLGVLKNFLSLVVIEKEKGKEKKSKESYNANINIHQKCIKSALKSLKIQRKKNKVQSNILYCYNT